MASREAYPREACGLLVGRVVPGAGAEVVREHACRNTAAAEDQFTLHPEDFLAGELAALADGLSVVGVWHSHPSCPATPSEMDHAGAYPTWSYVIVRAESSGTHELRSWRLVDGQFLEQPLTSTV